MYDSCYDSLSHPDHTVTSTMFAATSAVAASDNGGWWLRPVIVRQELLNSTKHMRFELESLNKCDTADAQATSHTVQYETVSYLYHTVVLTIVQLYTIIQYCTTLVRSRTRKRQPAQQ